MKSVTKYCAETWASHRLTFKMCGTCRSHTRLLAGAENAEMLAANERRSLRGTKDRRTRTSRRERQKDKGYAQMVGLGRQVGHPSKGSEGLHGIVLNCIAVVHMED